MIISFFGKHEEEVLQWEKLVHASNGETINFLIVVKNISSLTVNNVSVAANITGGVAYAGNLKINEFPYEGHIANGVILGDLPPASSKAISFNGVVQYPYGPSALETIATVNAENNVYDIDSFIIQITDSPVQSIATASLYESGAWNLLKSWFPWIIIILIAAAIFFTLFRRISSPRA